MTPRRREILEFMKGQVGTVPAVNAITGLESGIKSPDGTMRYMPERTSLAPESISIAGYVVIGEPIGHPDDLSPRKILVLSDRRLISPVAYQISGDSFAFIQGHVVIDCAYSEDDRVLATIDDRVVSGHWQAGTFVPEENSSKVKGGAAIILGRIVSFQQ